MSPLDMANKKILITGGLGYVGSALLRNLGEGVSSEVIILDNLKSRRYPSLFDLPKGRKYKFIKDNIVTADFDKYLKGVDIVIHLAAWVNAEDSYKHPKRSDRTIFQGLKKVADACLRNNVSLFFPSTTAVYTSKMPVVDETCLDLNPQSPYATAKLNSEKYLEKLGKNGLKYVICRFGTIYGHSVGIHYVTAVNKFIWQAVNGEPLTLWRKRVLTQKRPYLYLGDCIGAINFVIKKDLFNKQIYNVVTENLTVKDIVSAIKLSLKVKTIYVDSPNMNNLSYEASTEKFEALGFKFSGELKKGARESINKLGGIW